MAWLKTRRPSTRELVRAEHRLQAARGARAGRLIILALLCVIGALLYLRLDEQAAARNADRGFADVGICRDRKIQRL